MPKITKDSPPEEIITDCGRTGSPATKSSMPAEPTGGPRVGVIDGDDGKLINPMIGAMARELETSIIDRDITMPPST